MRALLDRLYADVAMLLLEGHGVEPLLYPLDDASAAADADPDLDYATWCDGYLAGMAVADPPWSDFTDAEDLDARLAPFVALVMEGAETGRRTDRRSTACRPRNWPRSPPWPATICRRRRRKCTTTSTPAGRSSNRSDARSAKVGRNDPCPCGSGRKFKHCHGAA